MIQLHVLTRQFILLPYFMQSFATLLLHSQCCSSCTCMLHALLMRMRPFHADRPGPHPAQHLSVCTIYCPVIRHAQCLLVLVQQPPTACAAAVGYGATSV